MAEGIRRIGIVGGGKMGQNLFQYLSGFNLELCLYVRGNPEKMLKKHERKLNRQFKNGLISQDIFQFKIKKQIISSSLNDLSRADLVIECISEDLRQKNQLYIALEKILPEHTIIASNSSSITPDQFSLSQSRKKNTVGLHFFFPIELKNIVEFVVSSDTSVSTEKTVEGFLKCIGKSFLKQTTQSAFVLNKIMLDIQAEAYSLSLEKKIPLKMIDEAVQEGFLSIGIFEMMDHIGLDVLHNSLHNYLNTLNERKKYDLLSNKLQELIDDGSFGIKSERGFYDYKQNDLATENLEESSMNSAEILDYLEGIYRDSLLHYSMEGKYEIPELESAMKEYLSI